MLETELPWSAEWLFLVDVERAIAVAKDLESKWRGSPHQNVDWLQKQLVRYTGDLTY